VVLATVPLLCVNVAVLPKFELLLVETWKPAGGVTVKFPFSAEPETVKVAVEESVP
jgi:hypothetical protein